MLGGWEKTVRLMKNDMGNAIYNLYIFFRFYFVWTAQKTDTIVWCKIDTKTKNMSYLFEDEMGKLNKEFLLEAHLVMLNATLWVTSQIG